MRSALERAVRTQCFHSETGFGPGFQTVPVSSQVEVVEREIERDGRSLTHCVQAHDWKFGSHIMSARWLILLNSEKPDTAKITHTHTPPQARYSNRKPVSHQLAMEVSREGSGNFGIGRAGVSKQQTKLWQDRCELTSHFRWPLNGPLHFWANQRQAPENNNELAG